MLLGVVSDTHGHLHNTLEAVELFRSQHVDVVIHCGDIGSTTIPALFRDWPTHFVLGNVDRPAEEFERAVVAANLTFHGRFGNLELAGRRIAWLHGDDPRRWKEVTSGGQWDLVCYGHTHQALERFEGATHVLNPGAVYRAKPHSVAVVRLPELTVEFLTF
ncbi:MAG: YfcE family phosphodiesterase [Pirellulaceae bacterium]